MIVLVLFLLLLLVRSHEAEALQLRHNQPPTLPRYVCVRLEKRAGPLRGPPFPALPSPSSKPPSLLPLCNCGGNRSTQPRL